MHAGDLVLPAGVDELAKFTGDAYFVWGNNEVEREAIAAKMASSDKLHLANGTLDITIGDTRVFMNHYPEVAQAAFSLKIHDLVIHGHDHVYRVEEKDGRFLINPGEACRRITGTATFVIFDTETKSVGRIELTG